MLQKILFSVLICLLLSCSSSVKKENIITTPDDFATYDTVPSYTSNAAQNFSNEVQTFSNETQNNASIDVFSGRIRYNNTEEQQLEEEYQQISKQLDALQAEFKAVVNAQMVAQDYLINPYDNTCRKAYEKKMEILLKIRRENEQNALPVGPYIENKADISWVVQTLKNNYDILSNRMSELKKKKGKIASKQLFLKANN